MFYNLVDNDPSTVAGKAYMLSCNLDAYLDPVPPGKMGVEERDALALRLAENWQRVEDAGGKSCVWHEIAMHYGTECRCARCA